MADQAGYGNPAPYVAEGPRGELAPWGSRVAAALIDLAILLGLQLLFAPVSSRLAQLVVIGVDVLFAYLVGTRGQSPGKQALKIKVVRDSDGQLVGFGTALVRWLLHVVDALPFGLGFLWPLWDNKKQTFADKIVSTVVVRA